jgi:hypothetical protein
MNSPSLPSEPPCSASECIGGTRSASVETRASPRQALPATAHYPQRYPPSRRARCSARGSRRVRCRAGRCRSASSSDRTSCVVRNHRRRKRRRIDLLSRMITHCRLRSIYVTSRHEVSGRWETQRVSTSVRCGPISCLPTSVDSLSLQRLAGTEASLACASATWCSRANASPRAVPRRTAGADAGIRSVANPELQCVHAVARRIFRGPLSPSRHGEPSLRVAVGTVVTRRRVTGASSDR